MSKQKLIDEIENMSVQSGDDYYNDGYRRAVEDIVEAIHSHNPWHRWPDKKPKIVAFYLVVRIFPKKDTDNPFYRQLEKALYDDRGLWWGDGNQPLNDAITHFQPLPELPKEGE